MKSPCSGFVRAKPPLRTRSQSRITTNCELMITSWEFYAPFRASKRIRENALCPFFTKEIISRPFVQPTRRGPKFLSPARMWIIEEIHWIECSMALASRGLKNRRVTTVARQSRYWNKAFCMHGDVGRHCRSNKASVGLIGLSYLVYGTIRRFELVVS